MKQELIEIIKKSDLSQEAREEWENMVSIMPDDAAEVILKTIKEGIQDLGQMNEFYQRKKQAMAIIKEDKIKGQEMLDAIYCEEAEILNNLE